MKHYREIDILRGIAIIMVFLGHAVIVYPINLENVAWCRGLVAFISAVHMPLFFIVAGFCFHRKSTYVDMVQKKIKRLLVPYVSKRQIMRQSLNSTPPVMGGAASSP